MAMSENIINKFEDDYKFLEIPVLAGALHFYQGSLVNITAAGYATPGSDAASEIFVGVSEDELDQATGGANGDNKLKIIAAKSNRAIKLKLTGVVQADVYQKCYVNGDDEVALAATTTNDVEVGTIVRLAEEANYCFVLLN